MKQLRKTIFYIFAVIYLVSCPLIVGRMLGFVFNPLTHRFVKTGLVSITTIPADATVYIDGRIAPQKTPAVIRDLTPGEHFIRIELDGYKDWERNVPLFKKKATVLNDLLLVPVQWPLKLVSKGPYRNIFITADGILVAENPVLRDIDIFHAQDIDDDVDNDPKIPLFTAQSIYADGRLVHLYHSYDSPYILLQAKIADKDKFLWVNLKEDPPHIEDISDLFPGLPLQIIWNKSDTDNIFAGYPDKIYRINIKDKTISPQDSVVLPYHFNPAPRPRDHFLINSNHDLLIREKRKIRLYPQQNFGTPEVFDIAVSNPTTNMYFEEKNGELFYLDEALNLCQVQVMPIHPLLDINNEISLLKRKS